MFSVLICTYNRPQTLKAALKALVEQTDEKPDEVIVVNGGNEEANLVVQSFNRNSNQNIKLVKTVNKNLATSRNIGLKHCTGEIIAMTDDDAEVFSDWVTAMKRAHQEHPEAGAVGGMVLGSNTETLVGRVADVITFPAWEQAQSVRTLPGVNISYKKSFIEKIGWQDETLFRGEDVDYNWRIQQAGGIIWYDPRIKVHHCHRPTLRGFLNQHYMYGRAYYLVRCKWQDMYSIYPHHMNKPRDFLKLMNFFAAMFYQPILSCTKMPRAADKPPAILLLFAAGVAWRWGMAEQRFFHKD